MKLYCYGLLKKGFALSTYIKECEYIGVSFLSGYDMYSNGSYPMIIKGSGTIKGEVYEVNKETLDYLDSVEYGYNRKIVKVLVNGKEEDCYVYIWKGSVERLNKIKGGEFK